MNGLLNYVRNTYSIYFLTILLFSGFFFPTSINETMSNSFTYFIGGVLILYFIVFFKKTSNKSALLPSIMIHFLLMIFTLTASIYVSDISTGIYINFICLSLLFLLDLKEIKIQNLGFPFVLINIIIIILGYGVILQNEVIITFLKNYYTASYEDLLVYMFASLKPVGTFATHSVAGFVYFLLFYISYETFLKKRKILYLILAINLLILMFFIASNTSLLFLGISVLYIAYATFTSLKNVLLFIALFLFITLIIYFQFQDNFIVNSVLNFDINSVLSGKDNGFSSRYSETSGLMKTIDYVFDHPFLGLGLTFDSKLTYTDSGFVLYALRGTFLLVIAIYIGFYLFLKRNLNTTFYAHFVFFSFMLFEIGYPSLLVLRILYFLPFMIVYLNNLSTEND